MWNMAFKATIRILTITGALIAASNGNTLASPTLYITAAPSSARIYTAIYPAADARENGATVTEVILYYSWDNSNWTTLAANPTPTAVQL